MEDHLYTPYTKPFRHQQDTWEYSRELDAYAAFWEQGTGKTKLDIDTTGYLWDAKEIDAAIVVAPNGVHRNWISDELPTHLPPDFPVHPFAWKGDASSTVWHKRAFEDLLNSPRLAFLAISYDAWMTPLGKKAVWAMMRKRKTRLTLDESHRVKTPTAARTKSILLGGKHAIYKRILSGTPITQGPFDIYSQIKFLDPTFWIRELDIDSYSAFKSYFGVWDVGYTKRMVKGVLKTVEYPILDCYNNLDELSAAIKKISSRVTKDEVLDLPEKIYTKRYYEMTPTQRRIYDELDADLMTILDDGRIVSAPLVITKLLRMQQVLCGYIPVDGDSEPFEFIDRDNNPRLKLLRDTMEDVPGKAIIWATWTRDIDMIMDTLRAIGRKPVRYDGTVSDDEKERAKREFKEGDATDFVGNSQMSEGLTLNEARTTIYYNNSYKLIDRKQTEDRNHRIGQTNHVTYIDLVCPGTRDEAAIEALVKKAEVAAIILGDKQEKWL